MRFPIGFRPFRTTMSGEKILEGCFAIHKPEGVTSADVLRKCQEHFNPSKTFAPWLQNERDRRERENKFQQNRRRQKKIEVKIGHGGTLDPLATGILIAGVGKGTKSLSSFLGCTKSYETIVLFGAETDTYDRMGRIVRRAPYEHVTREKVEEALKQFRGPIMQKPPIFSALRINGKRLYEYAREGKLPPVEIKSRPVEAVELEIVEWYEPGTHEHKWPKEKMEGEEKRVAEQLLDQQAGTAAPVAEAETAAASSKRSAADTPEVEHGADKKQKISESGEAQAAAAETAATDAPAPAADAEAEADYLSSDSESTAGDGTKKRRPQAPAVKIRMTVTSGFYVRSLAHDLGNAVGSCALMSELIRTRQGDFELVPEKVLQYEDLANGEEVWGPKVEGFLSAWEEKIASQAAEDIKAKQEAEETKANQAAEAHKPDQEVDAPKVEQEADATK
ncbi:hypothetical protein N7466_002273 [Penicillium verhagenii]|uniref:uncharacterized protein n=1 Tax=Penicillium verhagenii TaxID=1562060 RepID=UPI002545337D|nr:uncharacterized protein N7466_002273 [Penicillium verhagenii]KAJ5939139.1 hypothetical protein N7466_002273 [Penicillium verhagenii]